MWGFVLFVLCASCEKCVVWCVILLCNNWSRVELSIFPASNSGSVKPRHQKHLQFHLETVTWVLSTLRSFSRTLFKKEEFENAIIGAAGHPGSVVEENLSRKSTSSIFKMLSVYTDAQKMAISNSSFLKSVLEKLRFRDGLAWTEGLTVEIKLRFQIFQA